MTSHEVYLIDHPDYFGDIDTPEISTLLPGRTLLEVMKDMAAVDATTGNFIHKEKGKEAYDALNNLVKPDAAFEAMDVEFKYID